MTVFHGCIRREGFSFCLQWCRRRSQQLSVFKYVAGKTSFVAHRNFRKQVHLHKRCCSSSHNEFDSKWWFPRLLGLANVSILKYWYHLGVFYKLVCIEEGCFNSHLLRLKFIEVSHSFGSDQAGRRRDFALLCSEKYAHIEANVVHYVLNILLRRFSIHLLVIFL